MIGLTRTSGERCCLDPAQIQRIESCPDTVAGATGAELAVQCATMGKSLEASRVSDGFALLHPASAAVATKSRRAVVRFI